MHDILYKNNNNNIIYRVNVIGVFPFLPFFLFVAVDIIIILVIFLYKHIYDRRTKNTCDTILFRTNSNDDVYATNIFLCHTTTQ